MLGRLLRLCKLVKVPSPGLTEVEAYQGLYGPHNRSGEVSPFSLGALWMDWDRLLWL